MDKLWEFIIMLVVGFIVGIVIVGIIWGIASLVIWMMGVSVTNPYSITAKDVLFAVLILDLGFVALIGAK